MYFFVDTEDKSVTAFQKLSVAAKAALEKIGVDYPSGGDPVAIANEHLGDRGILLNISGAFEAIEDSEGEAAQELAHDFRVAINAFYEAKR